MDVARSPWDSRRPQNGMRHLDRSTAGTVSKGAMHPLRAIAEVQGEGTLVTSGRRLWRAGRRSARRVRVPRDAYETRCSGPDKWLYAPLEAGCALGRDPAMLRRRLRTHSHIPSTGAMRAAPNYYEYGSRTPRLPRPKSGGVAAVGRRGYQARSARTSALRCCLTWSPATGLHAVTRGLSITPPVGDQVRPNDSAQTRRSTC